MSSSSSESDSDEEIARLFARAKQQTSARKRLRQIPQRHQENDGENDDDSIELLGENKRRVEVIDISDDDDDTDSDDEKFVAKTESKSILQTSSVILMGGRQPRDPSRNALAAYRNLAEKQMHPPEPDSDDEEAAKPKLTLEELQQAGASEEALECLRQARKARSALELTQQQSLLSPTSPIYKMSYNDDDDSVEAVDPEALLGDLLTLQVLAEIREGTNASNKSIQATMHSNQHFSLLEKTIVELLELPPSSRVVLKFQGKLLKSNRPACLSNIPAQGATIEATVFAGVSEVPKKSKKASQADQWGKPMALTIRGSTGKVDMKLGAKQPFQHLLNELAQKYGKNAGDIQLMFDGETLNPNQTPINYDMEDEDLIEAKGI